MVMDNRIVYWWENLTFNQFLRTWPYDVLIASTYKTNNKNWVVTGMWDCWYESNNSRFLGSIMPNEGCSRSFVHLGIGKFYRFRGVQTPIVLRDGHGSRTLLDSPRTRPFYKGLGLNFWDPSDPDPGLDPKKFWRVRVRVLRWRPGPGPGP